MPTSSSDPIMSTVAMTTTTTTAVTINTEGSDDTDAPVTSVSDSNTATLQEGDNNAIIL